MISEDVMFPSLYHVAFLICFSILSSYYIGRPLVRLLIEESEVYHFFAIPLGILVYSILSIPFFFLVPFSPLYGTFFFLSAIALSNIYGRRTTLVLDKTSTYIPWFVFIGAALMASTVSAALFPKFSGDLTSFAPPIFDHVKVAIVDEIYRSGLPPQSPFFFEKGQETTLVYYYLWHAMAAQLRFFPTITGWEAEIVMTWVAAFISLLVMAGVAVLISGRKASGLWVILLSLSGSFLPKFLDLKAPHVLEQWIVQAAWVPQHLFSAVSVFLAIWGCAKALREEQIHVPTIILTGLLIGGAYGASAWVGGITQAAILTVLFLIFSRQIPIKRLIGRGAGIGAIALLLALPFLLQQLVVINSPGTVISFEPLVTLQPLTIFYESFFPNPSTEIKIIYAILTPVISFVIYYAVFLPCCFGALYPMGLWFLDDMCSQNQNQKQKDIFFIFLSIFIASFNVAGFMQSVIKANDLGWRAVLPGLMVLIICSGALLGRIKTILQKQPFQQKLLLKGLIIVLLIFLTPSVILIGKYYFSDNLAISDYKEHLELTRAPELWQAVRAKTSSYERVLNNPTAFAEITPWPDNIGWGLLSDRRSCLSGSENMVTFTLLPLDDIIKKEDAVLRVYDGKGTAEDIHALRDNYACDAIVVTPDDVLWTKKDLETSGVYTLVSEVPDRWKIYRLSSNEERPDQ